MIRSPITIRRAAGSSFGKVGIALRVCIFGIRPVEINITRVPASPAFKLHHDESSAIKNHALLLERNVGLVIQVAALAPKRLQVPVEIFCGG